MKNIYKHVMLALLLLLGTANLYAQKRVSMGNGKNAAATLLVPDNANTKIINEHQALVSYGAEPKNVRHEGRATHNFKINISDGDWQEIHVASGENYLVDMYYGEAEEYNEAVEDGYYDILIVGFDENGEKCILTYDQIPVFEEMEFHATFNDCIYNLNTDGKDQNGNPLTNLDYVENDFLCYYSWLNNLRSVSSFYSGYQFYMQEVPNLRFSSCDERSSVTFVANLHTASQTVYSITFPFIYGISDDMLLSNDYEKLTCHTERYYVDDSESSIYHNDFISFFAENYFVGLFIRLVNLPFNPHQPLLFYSDTKTDDVNDFSNGAITLNFPTIYEYYHLNYSFPEYENKITPFCFYYNGEDKLVREPFGKTMDDILYHLMPSYLEWFPSTPVTVYSDPDEILYFGKRTPMIYSQSNVKKPEYTWSGQFGINAHILPIGENGCMRFGDKDGIFVMTVDGQEIFNDSLFKWENWNEMQVEISGVVTFDVNCHHLVVDGVEKSNHTFIEFDLTKDDIAAPTLTFLQVKDAYNHECVELTDLAQSTICFAAGDFSPHYTEEGGYGHFDYMQYDGKPSVEVYYSVDGNTWETLEITENEALFHENYGNVFTIDLSQLDGKVNDQWVSIKFVITDEAGNFQEQELKNLFYAGELTNVSESTATTSTVYPNPFQTSFTVNTVNPVSGKAVVNVYNVLGENVYTKAMNCSETTEFVIDGSSLNAGIYFYSIATENGTLQGRIVKE